VLNIPCWSTEGLSLLVYECKVVWVERNVKLMTSHSMDNALAESYKDIVQPLQAIQLFWGSVATVWIPLSIVYAPWQVVSVQGLQLLRKGLECAQHIVLWMRLTHTEVQEFFCYWFIHKKPLYSCFQLLAQGLALVSPDHLFLWVGSGHKTSL